MAERTLRPDHPTLALSLRHLGSTLEDLGDLDQSVALKERALAIAERKGYGPNHHETALYLYSVAYRGAVCGGLCNCSGAIPTGAENLRVSLRPLGMTSSRLRFRSSLGWMLASATSVQLDVSNRARSPFMNASGARTIRTWQTH